VTWSGGDALKEKLLDPGSPVLLYGTTPPRTGTADDAVRAVAEKLAVRLRDLPADGVVVYDIQDESGRTKLERPFAFTGTVDPRGYAHLLAARTGRPTITYKCVGDLDESRWLAWLTETANEYGAGCLSIVGRPTSGARCPLALSTAIRIAARHPAGFTVGGVVIAERHTERRSESARLLAKGSEGCSYFISQTVYHADATGRLLSDYVRDCRGAGVQPRRIVLTFAPAGREKTITFSSGSVCTSRSRRRPRSSAPRTQSPDRSRSAATTCDGFSTMTTSARSRSASTSRASRSTATRSTRA
jgi:hypothetical protein